jgi:hypothetical protein
MMKWSQQKLTIRKTSSELKASEAGLRFNKVAGGSRTKAGNAHQ